MLRSLPRFCAASTLPRLPWVVRDVQSLAGVRWVDLYGNIEALRATARSSKRESDSSGEGALYAQMLSDDGGFVRAVESLLRLYGVPDELIHYSQQPVWLPTTYVARTRGADDESSKGAPPPLLFVCRCARVAEDARPFFADPGVVQTEQQPPPPPPPKRFTSEWWSAQRKRLRALSAAATSGRRQRSGIRVLASDMTRKRVTRLRRHIARRRRLQQQQQARAKFQPSDVSAAPGSGVMNALLHGRGVTENFESSADDELSEKDATAATAGDTILELSHRLSVFVLPAQSLVITVHKFHLPHVAALQREWHGAGRQHHQLRMTTPTVDALLFRLVQGAVKSFLIAESYHLEAIDKLEASLFSKRRRRDERDDRDGALARALRLLASVPNRSEQDLALLRLQAIHRQASANLRVLRALPVAHAAMTNALLAVATAKSSGKGVAEVTRARQARRLQGDLAASIAQCEGLREQAQSLLFLYCAVNAYETEDMVRLLTLFSTCFIPVELLFGLMGTELSSVQAFGASDAARPVVGAAALVIVAVTYWWLNRRLSARF